MSHACNGSGPRAQPNQSPVNTHHPHCSHHAHTRLHPNVGLSKRCLGLVACTSRDGEAGACLRFVSALNQNITCRAQSAGGITPAAQSAACMLHAGRTAQHGAAQRSAAHHRDTTCLPELASSCTTLKSIHSCSGGCMPGRRAIVRIRSQTASMPLEAAKGVGRGSTACQAV